VYSFLSKYGLYPLAERFSGTTLINYLKILEETQWWSPEQLRELQNEKLRALIKHAYTKVPYYRSLFRERGLTDKDICTVDDLHKLPVLTKDDIRHNFQELLAEDYKKRRPLLDATGGSTGEPLKYYTCMDALSISWAATYRAWEWAGYKIGDRRATLAGSSLVPWEKPTIKNCIRNIIERNLPLSSIGMDKARMHIYLEKILKHKTKFLRGYPSVIYLFAKYLHDNGIDSFKPKAVFTTAEMLLPSYRKVIENQFNCRVFDHYGCRDGSANANECKEHKGFHISTELVAMEFVKNGNPLSPGQPGDILLTDLHNYAMPFIRYQVGDIGILSESTCPCGRSLPLIKELRGRTTDAIVFSNGKALSGPALTLIFKGLNIHQYQAIQTGKDKLLMRIIKDNDYSDEDTRHFMGVLRSHLGKDVIIDFEFVDKIPTTIAGKHRFIVSETVE